MYAHTAKTGNISKPCDGVRYNALHGTSLNMHEIDMLGTRKPYAKSKPRKGKGGRKCGGMMYSFFHPKDPDIRVVSRKKNYRHPQRTIDTHIGDYTPETGKKVEQDVSQQYAQDMSSVEEMLAYTAEQDEAYRKHLQKAPERIYSRIEKELREHTEKDPAYSVAEEVEKKYSKKYEIKVYKGSDRKKDIKEAKTENALEKALKGKHIKKQKVKNETNRRALSSGSEAVRKGSERSSRKSKSKKSKHNTKYAKHKKHKSKPKSGRKV